MAADKEPGRIPKELIGYFEGKALRPSWSYKDLWGDEHKAAFTVAKAMELDILKDFRDAIVEAQTKGIPFEKFARDITPVLESKGWFGKAMPGKAGKAPSKKAKARRLKTIYDTNLRTARADGQWERIQRRKKAQPMLRYRLGASAKHRPEHVALDGLIYPVDHPFWQTHFTPNGHGCNCWVETLTRARADDLGGTAPDLDPRLFPPETYRDPRDGKKRTTPFGVDPGFEFKPGFKGRMNGLNQNLADK